MAENESIGGVRVDIVGDYSSLSSSIDGALEVARQGGEQVAQAFNAGSEGVDTLSKSLTTAGESARAIEQEVGGLATALEQVGSAAGSIGSGLTTALDGMAGAMETAGSSAKTFEDQIQELVDSGSTLNEALAKVLATSTEFGSGIEEAGAAAGSAASDLEQMGSAAETIGDSLGAAGQSAATAAEQLNIFDEAVSVPYADAAGQLNLFSDALEPIPGAATSAADAMKQAADEEQKLGQNAHNAAPPVQELSEHVATLGEKLIAIGEAFVFTEALVEIAKDALEASDRVDDAGKSIARLTGSAPQAARAIGELRDVARDDALSMPQLLTASTRLTAFLGTAAPIPDILRHIADSAAVMNTSIEAASGAFERIVASGEISQRSLIRLGLTMEDVAKAMHTTADSAKEAFKELDQSEKLEVMLRALEKFKGAAKDTTDDALGAMARLKLSWDEALEAIGTALDPVIKKLAEFADTHVAKTITDLAEAFAGLPDPIKDTAIAVGVLTVAIVPLTAGVGALAIGLGALGPALAPVGAALAGMGAGITGVTASYGAMVAAGVLSVVTWAALAGAILYVAAAYHEMRVAQDLETKAGKDAADSLATYEIALRRHGVDISEVRAQYDAGKITVDQYIAKLGQLRDEFLKTHPVAQGAADSARAIASANELAAMKMQSLKDAVASTWDAVQKVNAKYQEHKATLADVAAAYDKWVGASNALKSAQEAQLPVVTKIVEGYKAFNEATFAIVPAEQAMGNSAEATKIRVESLNISLQHANQNLRDALAAYQSDATKWDGVVKALEGVARASKAIQDVWDAAPKIEGGWLKTLAESAEAAHGVLSKLAPEIEASIGPAVKDLALSTTQAAGAFKELIPQVQFLPGPLGEAYAILDRMHVKIGENARDIETLAKDYVQLATVPHTLDMMDAAWLKVSGSINKLAQVDLPAAIQVMQTHIGVLQQQGAAQGEIYGQQEKMLELEITSAEQRGKDATDQILHLEAVKLRQEALKDQARLVGDLFVSVGHDISKAWGDVGKAIADCIVDGTNFQDAMKAIGKNVLKMVLEDLVGTAFKAMKDALIGVATNVKDLGHQFEELAKTVNKAIGAGADTASAAAQGGKAAAGAASSTTGILASLGSVASIVTAIATVVNGIVQSFQLAKLENTMNHVEENTRYTEIKFAKFAESDEWQRHGEIMAKWDLLDIRNVDQMKGLNAIKDAIGLSNYQDQFGWIFDKLGAALAAQLNNLDIHWFWDKLNALLLSMWNIDSPHIASMDSHLKNIEAYAQDSRNYLSTISTMRPLAVEGGGTLVEPKAMARTSDLPGVDPASVTKSTVDRIADLVNFQPYVEWLWAQESKMLVGQFNVYLLKWDKTNEYLATIAGSGSNAGSGDVHWLWNQMQPMSVAQFNSNQSVLGHIDATLSAAAPIWAMISETLTSAKNYLGSIDMTMKGVPKFASGTTYVPHDMLAVVHQGEAIIPAAQNLAQSTATVPSMAETSAVQTSASSATQTASGYTYPSIAEGSLSYAHQSATTAASTATQPTASHIGMMDMPLKLPTVAAGNQLAQMAMALPTIPTISDSGTFLAGSGPQPLSTSTTGGSITQNVDIKVYEASNPRETARQIATTLKTLTGRLGPGMGS